MHKNFNLGNWTINDFEKVGLQKKGSKEIFRILKVKKAAGSKNFQTH